jgi:lysophospholipase L1-like esterase
MIPTIRPSIRNSIVGAIRGVRVLPKVDYMVAIGSSVTVQTYVDNPVLGLQQQNTRSAFCAAGLDMPVISKAVSGATIADTIASLPAAIASLGGTTKKCLFVINIGANDIGSTDYYLYDPTARDALFAGLKNIVDQITSAGYMACLCTSNSREGYADMYEIWANNMYRMLSKQLTPYWYNGPLTVIDYCRLYLINKDVPNWWQVDGLHPNLAMVPSRDMTISAIKANSLYNKIDALQSFIFAFQVTGGTIGGFTSPTVGVAGSTATVYDTKGNLISGVSMSWTAAGGSSTGRGNAGNFDISLYNDILQKGHLFKTGSWDTVFSFGVAYANRTGTVYLTYNASNVNPRASRFTSTGFGAFVVVDGKATNPDVKSTTFTLDASGDITINTAPEAPATVCGLSGVQFTFN